MEDSVDKTTDDRLITKRRYVDEYLDNSREEREWAELHRDYFDDKQWTDEEIAVLTARGQPVITDNKIKDKVEYLEGVERKTRTDPKAFPRTPVHEEDADVATDAIRYVFDDNRFQMTKSAVFQNLLIEGFGGAEVIVDKDNPKKILIRKVRWDRLYRDPYSLEPDCSDATYLGTITWLDSSRAKYKWKDKAAIIDACDSAGNSTQSRNSGETTDDRPRWLDAKRKRIQVFEHYERREGKIYRSVFCWGGFLEEEAECVYEDEDGKHEWPLVIASAYIDRDGRRYGIVKRYVSLQDEVNKRRSKALHLLNSKQIIADRGAFDDGDGGNGLATARKQLHLPDGAIEKNQGFEVEILDGLELSAGHFQLLQQAEMALGATGPNAALLGQSGAISGRAKELDQQGGAVQIGVLFDAIRDWQLRVAKAVWNRIRQYWDEEMIIRVTDTEIGIKFVKLNERMTRGELAARQLKGKPEEEVAAALEQIASDPQSTLPATANDVAKLEVDIIIDEAPDVITLQAEEFEKLAQLAGSGAVQIPPDALIEASGLRAATKKRILDVMKGADDPMAKMQAQFAQMMQDLEARLKTAEVRETNASAALKEAQAGKAEVDAITSTADSLEAPVAPAGRELSQPPSRSLQA